MKTPAAALCLLLTGVLLTGCQSAANPEPPVAEKPKTAIDFGITYTRKREIMTEIVRQLERELAAAESKAGDLQRGIELSPEIEARYNEAMSNAERIRDRLTEARLQLSGL